MTFLRTGYRGIEAILKDMPDLRALLGLRRVPGHFTLHKAARRLLGQPAISKLFYGQRWQVETANSMIKRNLTHALSVVGYHAQGRQTRLLAITHNIMI